LLLEEFAAGLQTGQWCFGSILFSSFFPSFICSLLDALFTGFQVNQHAATRVSFNVKLNRDMML